MTSPRKRRWYAFRLRTLLIVVVVLGCVLTPVAMKVKKARDQKKAVEWALDNGGSVQYDWESDDGSPATAHGPKWLRRLVGDECFQSVRSVTFNGTRPHYSLGNVPPKGLINLRKLSDLTPLQGLTNLRVLILVKTRVSDLSPLKGMKELRELDLSHTQVSDLTPLRGLTNLRHLSLQGTQVADLRPLIGLTNLQKLLLSGTQVIDLSPLSALTKLHELELWGTRINDLTPLTRLTNLQKLDVGGTNVSDMSPLKELRNLRKLGLFFASQVTDEQVQRLRKALPDCKFPGSQIKK